MNRLVNAIALGFVLALGTVSAAGAADAADPVIGTWNLNLAKSKFHGDTAPKSMTRTYSAGAGGTDMKVTGTAADGSAVSQSATLTYDGKDVAVSGNPAFDSMTLTKVNGSTVKSEQKKGGQVVGHTTRTISAKGKVMTLLTSMKTPKGGTVHDTAVFDKQ